MYVGVRVVLRKGVLTEGDVGWKRNMIMMGKSGCVEGRCGGRGRQGGRQKGETGWQRGETDVSTGGGREAKTGEATVSETQKWKLDGRRKGREWKGGKEGRRERMRKGGEVKVSWQ